MFKKKESKTNTVDKKSYNYNYLFHLALTFTFKAILLLTKEKNFKWQSRNLKNDNVRLFWFSNFSYFVTQKLSNEKKKENENKNKTG